MTIAIVKFPTGEYRTPELWPDGGEAHFIRSIQDAGGVTIRDDSARPVRFIPFHQIIDITFVPEVSDK